MTKGLLAGVEENGICIGVVTLPDGGAIVEGIQRCVKGILPIASQVSQLSHHAELDEAELSKVFDQFFF